MLFTFISLLIKDDEAHPEAVRQLVLAPRTGFCVYAAETQDVDEEDFEEEQNLVARLVHHLYSAESEEQYRILLAARRHFGQGGPKRLRHTLPPLIFSGLQLVRQLHAKLEGEEGAAPCYSQSLVACLSTAAACRH